MGAASDIASALWTQQNRFLSLDTALGPNKLLLRSFTGREAISQLFRFDLDMLSEDFNIDFDKVIGSKMTIGLQLSDGISRRYFHGIVSRFVQLPQDGRLAHYTAEVVPHLWLLTRTTDCLIFQNKSVPDIIEEIFKKYDLKDYELQLQGTYQPWEYCVQYRETACNFVMRLMEQEGIFFFFKHEKDKHILVLADSPSASKPCPDQEEFRYYPEYGHESSHDEDVVMSWQMEQEMRPGKYAVTDYNFETPSTSLMANVDSLIKQGGNTKYEVYDYPGEYEKRNQGDTQVRVRMEEEEVLHTVISGGGTGRAFVSGFRFVLSRHQRPDQNGTYLITSIEHSAHEGGLYSGVGSVEGASYENTFNCIPHSIPYRPQRLTPKPLIQGTQTAVVTGPSGEEIYTDKYGRVKIQFHWDRVGKRDENSSCWIRVSHPWAGKGWGAISIPRIGQEVVVDFLEGDPDRPIITGRVYNAGQMPPWGLPGGKVISGIKSDSTKGSGGYNEMSMDDTKGTEKVNIHAQYNMNTTVEHDKTKTVINDQKYLVKGNSHHHVNGNQMWQVDGNRHDHVNSNSAEKVDGNMSVKVGGKRDDHVRTVYAIEAGQQIHIKAGAMMVIEAGAQLTIKVGGSSVDLTPASVAIQAPTILLNSGGAPATGSGCSPADPTDPTDP